MKIVSVLTEPSVVDRIVRRVVAPLPVERLDGARSVALSRHR
jgi:hypothetical protein